MNIQSTMTTSHHTDFAASPIKTDRQLLRELHMSDTEAAMFLGRTRQTLINHLGPKKSTSPSSSSYFKVQDILMLVSAARQMGRQFDARAVATYVSTTRPRGSEPDETHDLLDSLLTGASGNFSLEHATAVVFVLPAFAEMRMRRSGIADDLHDMVDKAKARVNPPSLFLLATTDLQARAAGDWLGIDRACCFGRDLVEHYLPSILVYDREKDEAHPFVLTDSGEFVPSPRFMSQMVADCLKSLLPTTAGKALAPARGKVVNQKA